MRAKIIGYEIVEEKPSVLRWDGDQPVFYKKNGPSSWVNVTIQMDGDVPDLGKILRAGEVNITEVA
jgi:hypothetical protein